MSDNELQIQMIELYRVWLERMWGRKVSELEACRLWAIKHAKEYRIHHPFKGEE